MTEDTPSTSGGQTRLDYFRYRVSRDLGGFASWFKAKWQGGWLFKLVAVAIVGFLLVWVAAWTLLARDLPDAESLLDYETPLPTVVRGIDGEIVHYYARERRVQLQYADFPQPLIEAYLAAEDKTFFSHGGVDFTGTANAVIDYISKYGSGERAVGGSTITQQVAKNLLLGDEYSVTRKLKEMILASRIEGVMSKEEIIELSARHRLGGHHLDLALDCRVHHDRGVGRLRHELDQLLNIGLFQVDREILGARDSRPQGSQQIKQRYSQCPQHGSH